jgi:phosphoadenylyl-sulfate reductase (thioredoxin)
VNCTGGWMIHVKEGIVTWEMQATDYPELEFAAGIQLLSHVPYSTARILAVRQKVTGIRREQSPTRSNLQKIEWDGNFGLLKLNPLADWTVGQLWDYVRERDVPYNPLHDGSYPSIGCTHCTRAVQPGEEPRAGRWSGFGKTECGLHIRD